MPHLVLEHSANVDATAFSKSLLLRFHTILNERAGIRIGNCKSRIVRHDHYAIGDGSAKQAFVHLGVSFLAGRSESARRAAGKALLDELRGALPDSNNLQITVEIRQIDSNDYHKWPPGTLGR